LASLDRSFRINLDLSRHPDCSTDTIYRPLAITWNSLRIKPPSVTDEFEDVVEHPDINRYSDQVVTSMISYQNSLMDNIRSTCMNASIHLQLEAIWNFQRSD
jgi:hypothetical protein